MSDQQAGQVAENAKRRLVLVTAGKVGAGKSTLINNLLVLKGEKAAEAKLSARSVTKSVDYYEKEIAGITVRIIDTPGFESIDLTNKQEQEALLTKLSEFSDGKLPDLLLYCVSLIGGRFDGRTVEKLNKAFGSAIWKHTILVLTFGDTVLTNYDEEEKEEFAHVDKNQEYRKLLEEYTTEFETALKKAGVSDVPVKPILPKSTQDDVHSLESALANPEITGIPVGRSRKRPPDWALLLFKEIIKKCNIHAIPALLFLQGITPQSVNEVLKESSTEGAAEGAAESKADRSYLKVIVGVVGGIVGGAVGGAVIGAATAGLGAGVGVGVGAAIGAEAAVLIGAGIGLVGGGTIGGIVPAGIYAGMTAKRKLEEWIGLGKIIKARMNLQKQLEGFS